MSNDTAIAVSYQLWEAAQKINRPSGSEIIENPEIVEKIIGALIGNIDSSLSHVKKEGQEISIVLATAEIVLGQVGQLFRGFEKAVDAITTARESYRVGRPSNQI